MYEMLQFNEMGLEVMEMFRFLACLPLLVLQAR